MQTAQSERLTPPLLSGTVAVSSANANKNTLIPRYAFLLTNFAGGNVRQGLRRSLSSPDSTRKDTGPHRSATTSQQTVRGLTGTHKHTTNAGIFIPMGAYASRKAAGQWKREFRKNSLRPILTSHKWRFLNRNVLRLVY